MNDLTSILEQLRVYRETLERDPDEVPARTRPGFENLRREAKDGIKGLTKEYGDKLYASSICFYPNGPEEKVTEFVAVAQQEAPSMIAVNARDLYTRLANSIWPSMEYKGQFTMDCYSSLVRELRYVAMDLDVAEIKPPRYGEPFACSKFSELVEYVTKLVREAMGDDLNKLYLRKQIVDCAIENKLTSALPIILIGAAPDEAKALGEEFTIFAPVPISSTTEITPEFAISTFKRYSKKQKKNEKTE